jgi:hypothetical protein
MCIENGIKWMVPVERLGWGCWILGAGNYGNEYFGKFRHG